MTNLASAPPIDPPFGRAVPVAARFFVYSRAERIYSDEVVTMTLSHPRQLIRFALSGALLLAFCIGCCAGRKQRRQPLKAGCCCAAI